MNAVALQAHFDGEKIVLDEPFVLEPQTRLIVTALPAEQTDEEREDWIRFSQQIGSCIWR